MQTKKCSTCHVEKDVSEFSQASNYKDGYRGQCKKCRCTYQRVYNQTPDGKTAQARAKVRMRPRRTHLVMRNEKLREKYGISHTEYEHILIEQGGGCAICGSQKSRGRYERFHVDHCHETGQVRGILCHPCNMALGQLGDNLESIMRVMNYLTSAPNH